MATHAAGRDAHALSAPRHTLDPPAALEAFATEGTFAGTARRLHRVPRSAIASPNAARRGICYSPAALRWRSAMRALLFTIASLSVPIGVAQAKPGHGHHGKSAMHAAGPLLNHADHLAKGLELTPAQSAQIAKIKADLEAAVVEDQKVMHNLHADLRALWSEAELPSREDVEALQARMHAARDRMAKATLEARFAARGVLNPTQAKALAAHKAEYAKAHGAGHGHHGQKACGGDCPGHDKADAPCPHAGK